mgnify:CR=1 FL=1
MEVNTKIQKIDCDWLDAKNECRNTVNKDATNVEATETFKKKLLVSEHKASFGEMAMGRYIFMGQRAFCETLARMGQVG